MTTNLTDALANLRVKFNDWSTKLGEATKDYVGPLSAPSKWNETTVETIKKFAVDAFLLLASGLALAIQTKFFFVGVVIGLIELKFGRIEEYLKNKFVKNFPLGTEPNGWFSAFGIQKSAEGEEKKVKVGLLHLVAITLLVTPSGFGSRASGVFIGREAVHRLADKYYEYKRQHPEQEPTTEVVEA